MKENTFFNSKFINIFWDTIVCRLDNVSIKGDRDLDEELSNSMVEWENMTLKQKYDNMAGWPKATVTTGETATVQGLDDVTIYMDNWSREARQSSEP